MDGWMGGLVSGWMDGWVSGWMDGWVDSYTYTEDCAARYDVRKCEVSLSGPNNQS